MFWNKEGKFISITQKMINRKHEMFWNSFVNSSPCSEIKLTVNMKCFEMKYSTYKIYCGYINRKHEMFWNAAIAALLCAFCSLTVNMKCFEIYCVHLPIDFDV